MKHIQVLGTGCAKCEKLYESVKTMAQELSVDFDIEKVSDINEIIKLGVIITPALIIDGQIKSSGTIPKPEDLKKFLS